MEKSIYKLESKMGEAMESIKLDKIMVNGKRIEYLFSVSEGLKQYFKNYNMFVEYNEDMSNCPLSVLVIPFVANILPLIWIVDGILWVEEIDREYYESLFNVKRAYQDMYYFYQLKGHIVTAKTIRNTYKVNQSAILLFSGGVDAITTSIRINELNPLLVNIFGWHKEDIREDKVFDSDEKNITEFSKRNNMMNTFVHSNFATVINARQIDRDYGRKVRDTWWHGFQHGTSFIGHAIPIAYQHAVENIYIASSFSIGTFKTISSYPTIDMEYRFASGGVIHDAFELSRQDKIKLIVEHQRKVGENFPLRVCSFNDKNCCECDKCIRTMLALVAEGAELDKFGFFVEADLITYFQNLVDKKLHLLGIEREATIHWPHIKKRMINNLDNIEEKDFVNWFLNFDFIEKRKKAILIYRIKNFFPIVKRKLYGG